MSCLLCMEGSIVPPTSSTSSHILDYGRIFLYWWYFHSERSWNESPTCPNCEFKFNYSKTSPFPDSSFSAHTYRAPAPVPVDRRFVKLEPGINVLVSIKVQRDCDMREEQQKSEKGHLVFSCLAWEDTKGQILSRDHNRCSLPLPLRERWQGQKLPNIDNGERKEDLRVRTLGHSCKITPWSKETDWESDGSVFSQCTNNSQ